MITVQDYKDGLDFIESVSSSEEERSERLYFWKTYAYPLISKKV